MIKAAFGRQADSISLLPVAYWQAARHSPEGVGMCMDGRDEQRSFIARTQAHDSYESLSLWCWCAPPPPPPPPPPPFIYLTSVAFHVKTLLHCNHLHAVITLPYETMTHVVVRHSLHSHVLTVLPSSPPSP